MTKQQKNKNEKGQGKKMSDFSLKHKIPHYVNRKKKVRDVMKCENNVEIGRSHSENARGNWWTIRTAGGNQEQSKRQRNETTVR